MKVGLYGGSFNPIHNGHVGLVKAVLEKKLVDKVLIIPCGNHAFGKNLVSSDDRMEMIERVFDDDSKVEIDYSEIISRETSSTYKTVMNLKKDSDDDFYWICGSDIFSEFEKWDHYQELAREVKFIVQYRGKSYPPEGSEIRIAEFMYEDLGSASSTMIREMIKNGEDISHLVPDRVNEYIGENGLYLK